MVVKPAHITDPNFLSSQRAGEWDQLALCDGRQGYANRFIAWLASNLVCMAASHAHFGTELYCDCP